MTLNRMTGNWWFPLDIFLVQQPNGDIWYYAPGTVGAVYVWNAATGTYTSPADAFDVLVKHANGTWTRTTKDGAQWHFNTGGYLDTIATRYSVTVTLARGAQNQLLSWTDYAGRTTSVNYYANGYASSIVDWGGRTVSFDYTAQGYLSNVTYPVTTYYDRVLGQTVTRNRTLALSYISGTGTAADGNVVTLFDDVGASMLSNTYDALDRATSTTTRGRTWTYSYLANGATRVVDPDGITTDYWLNGAGAISRREIWTRSGLGQPALRPGEPASYVWLYEYNSPCGCSLITKITNPDASTISMTWDPWGNLTSRTRQAVPAGPTLLETWTWAGFQQYCRLLTYTSAEGYRAGNNAADFTTTATYDSLGSLISVQLPKTERNGQSWYPVIAYTRSALGQLLTYVAPDGTTAAYGYDPVTLQCTSVTEDAGGLNSTVSYGYDTFDRMTSVTGPAGGTTTYEYNALDLMTAWYGPQPLSPRTVALYDQNGRYYTIDTENKDSSGNLISSNPWITTRYVCNAQSQMTAIEDEVSTSQTAVTQFEYTAAGRLNRAIDPTGVRTDIVYDERGLPFQVIAGAGTPLAGTTTFDYNLQGQRSRTLDARGNARIDQWDGFGRLQQVVWPDGRTDQYAWDNDGRLTSTSSVAGGILVSRTRMTYCPSGLQLTYSRDLINAQGVVTATATVSASYNSALRMTTLTLPNGQSVTYEYDRLARILRYIDAVQGIAEYSYSGGLVQSITRKEWNPVAGAHDIFVAEYAYDELGRCTSVTQRDAGSTNLRTRTWTHDGFGRVVAQSDPLGNTSSYAYDARGLPLSSTFDLRAGGVGSGAITGTIQTQRSYDPAGRVLTLTDGRGGITTYGYDARGRWISTTDANGLSEQFVRDAVGNATSITDRMGTVITQTFDASNRLVARAVARAAGVLGTTQEAYQYDFGDSFVTATDDDSVLSRAYDSFRRLSSETQNGKTFSYGYALGGTLLSVTYPDGAVETRTVDNGGRLTNVAVAGGPTVGPYTWAGLRPVALTMPGGVTRTTAYDTALRLATLEYAGPGGSIKKYEYAWTKTDERAYEKRFHAGGTGDNYAFDSRYQRVGVKTGVADPALEYATPGSQAFLSSDTITYDVAGNRAQIAVVGAGARVETYTPDPLNFYTSVVTAGVPPITQNLVRDANGNLRDDGTYLYAYDYRNQLVEIRLKASNALIASYEYDVLGRRTSKTVGAATRTFAWRGNNLGMEYDALGVFSRRHYAAAGAEVAAAYQRDLLDLDGDGLTTDLVWVYPMYDGAHDCVGLLKPNGALLESYVYTYDGLPTLTNAAGVPINASGVGWQQGYGKYYRDDESQLLYAMLRYYNPELGRFVTEDPIGRWGDAGNLGNGYAFLGNRYRNSHDPYGLKPAAPSKECDCDKKYALVWILRAMEWSTFGGGDTYPVYNPQVDRIRDAILNKYGAAAMAGKVFEWTTDDVYKEQRGDNVGKDSTFKQFTDKLEASKKDPCFEGMFLAGHGYRNGAFFMGRQGRPGDKTAPVHFLWPGNLGGLDHQLDWIIIYACGCGWTPPPGWDDATDSGPGSDTGEDFVAHPPPSTAPTSPTDPGYLYPGPQGTDLGNRADGAINHTAPSTASSP